MFSVKAIVRYAVVWRQLTMGDDRVTFAIHHNSKPHKCIAVPIGT